MNPVAPVRSTFFMSPDCQDRSVGTLTRGARLLTPDAAGQAARYGPPLWLDMANKTGRWEYTPFRGQLEQLVTTIPEFPVDARTQRMTRTEYPSAGASLTRRGHS